MAAREQGFSVADVLVMSALVLAGGAQFAAVGFIAQGVPWLAIVGFTALLNSRHLLYAAALAPFYQAVPRFRRAAIATVLTDEAFAVGIAETRSLGRRDETGYWLGAGLVAAAWIIATVAGAIAGQLIPDPRTLALDVIFPAVMAALAAGLATGRQRSPRRWGPPSSPSPSGSRSSPRSGSSQAASEGRPWRCWCASRDPGARAVITDLALLAVLMAAVTYPSRALPLLTPGIERLPAAALAYLRLVGPGCLAALAAVNTLIVRDETGQPQLHVGIEALAVLMTLAIVVWRRNLLLGLLPSVALVVVLRALGIG